MSKKYGFTIIEVSLFLAITALLFVGITVGTQNSINQQRYADSVNSFADFLRNVYSQVSNPQSAGKGNSKQAIYGKMISFGQTHDLEGNTASGGQIFVYDIFGDVRGEYGDGDLRNQLKELGATVIAKKNGKNDSGLETSTYSLAGMSESYVPRWDSKIESTNGSEQTGTIVIVRNPFSGTITTLISDTTFQINEKLKPFLSGEQLVYSGGSCVSGNCSTIGAAMTALQTSLSNGWASYNSKEISLCVNPFGDSAKRQEIRIAKGARNSSGVSVIELDGSDNKCKK